MNTIRQQFFYAHPLETVWDYLTKAELMTQWLMPNDFKPVVGHDFKFTTKPHEGHDGVFHCKVLEVVPQKKLSYSWKARSVTGEFFLDTVVVWTLIEKDRGTELQLTHSGFKEGSNDSILAAMTDGWNKLLKKMADHITQ